SIGNDLSKNNRTGFTALPAGIRDDKGVFNYIGLWSYWWTSTIGNSATNASFNYMLYNGDYSGSYLDGQMHRGASIRCIKD
ncbi:MAG TPA: FISUMP domain-containing protein, partial [Paludibacter sp.]